MWQVHNSDIEVNHFISQVSSSASSLQQGLLSSICIALVPCPWTSPKSACKALGTLIEGWPIHRTMISIIQMTLHCLQPGSCHIYSTACTNDRGACCKGSWVERGWFWYAHTPWAWQRAVANSSKHSHLESLVSSGCPGCELPKAACIDWSPGTAVEQAGLAW